MISEDITRLINVVYDGVCASKLGPITIGPNTNNILATQAFLTLLASVAPKGHQTCEIDHKGPKETWEE